MGENKFPNKYKKYIESWDKINIDFQVEIVDDRAANLLIKDSEFKTIITQDANLGFKSDIVRYLLLREKGGIYVDADFECKRPIKELIKGCSFLYGDQDKASPAIGLLASEPNGKFITFLTQTLHSLISNKNLNPKGFDSILSTSGPRFFEKIVKMWTLDSQFSPVFNSYGDHIGNQCGEIRALYEWVIYPYFPYLGTYKYNKIKNAKAYAVHHWGGTWIK